MAKDYSHLKGTEVKVIKMPSGLKAKNCFLGEIDNEKGLTIMGLIGGKQVKVFCIRDYDTRFDEQMKFTIESIQSGIFNIKKWIDEFGTAKNHHGEGQPICAFE